jgi:hypothetical protein
MSALITRSLAAFVPQDVRVVNIKTNLVPGYFTSRWSPRLPWDSDTPYALADCTAEVRNLSAEAVVLQLQETDDESFSGVRTNLGAAIAVVAGGTARVSFRPQRTYFEVKGIAGNGPVGIEIQTKIDWDNVGFSHRVDPTYPALLWEAEANFTAVIARSAAQTFTSSGSWVVVHNLGFLATATLLNQSGVDIASLAAMSDVTVNGYTATFSGGDQAGTAYSTR